MSVTGEMLVPQQVADRVGLSRAAIYREIRRGELPAALLCGRLRVAADDLVDWVEERRVSTAARSQARSPMIQPTRRRPARQGHFAAKLRASGAGR